MLIQGNLNKLILSIFFATVISSTGLNAQIDWIHVSDQPVFEYGAAGDWDNGAVFWPTVVRDGDTLRMWFAGSSDDLGFGTVQIGYAWSRSGITWKRFAGNPVLSAEHSWETGTVISPAVIKDGNTFKMWYGAGGIPSSIIGYATSADGKRWDRHPVPVLNPGPPGDWDCSILGPGSVIKQNDLYKMWYWGGEGSWPGSVIQIGLAISDDGINWVKHNDSTTTEPPFINSDPVLKVGGAGEWDQLRVWSPAILSANTGYEMYYAGREGAGAPPQLAGYATSIDGIEWTKSLDNPVIDTPPLWGLSYLTSAVIKFDNFYHLWYTSFTFGNRAQRAKIGYAKSRMLAGFSGGTDIPERYLLLQNYPNPFNSSTIVRYDLPEQANVALVIYDILGRRVKTLVQGVEKAGFQSVTWNGANELGIAVATGIYLYKINTGSFTQTRKMLLVK